MSRIIVAALLAVATGSTVAQPYPCKSVRYIVPAAAGGTTDIVARITGQKLAEALGVPVPVDNRGGAGGIIGAEALAKSVPDGCTIMMGNIGPNAINASLYRKLPYDAERDFAPITQAIGDQCFCGAPFGTRTVGEGVHSLCQGASRATDVQIGRAHV